MRELRRSCHQRSRSHGVHATVCCRLAASGPTSRTEVRAEVAGLLSETSQRRMTVLTTRDSWRRWSAGAFHMRRRRNTETLARTLHSTQGAWSACEFRPKRGLKQGCSCSPMLFWWCVQDVFLPLSRSCRAKHVGVGPQLARIGVGPYGILSNLSSCVLCRVPRGRLIAAETTPEAMHVRTACSPICTVHAQLSLVICSRAPRMRAGVENSWAKARP